MSDLTASLARNPCSVGGVRLPVGGAAGGYDGVDVQPRDQSCDSLGQGLATGFGMLGVLQHPGTLQIFG